MSNGLPQADRCRCGVSPSGLDSVGINRRGVVNERVIQERSSDHPDPEPCEGSREAALEALDREVTFCFGILPWTVALPKGHMRAGY